MVNLLRHGDRNSMRWSVESRVPYLDLDVVSFAQSVPEHYLLSSTGETKSILRHAMKDLLPAEVLFRRDKVGFEAPGLQWLRQMSKRATVLTEGLENIPWIDKQLVDTQLQEVLDGKRSFGNDYWRLINIAKWRKLYPANQ
jgi:asparagine synthase (glutamine-hydrolysing)